MQSNVINFPLSEGSRNYPVCPAHYYKFSGDPTMALGNELFMEKAAAFQEIRDCLVAADHKRLSKREAERLIQFFVQTYLSLS